MKPTLDRGRRRSRRRDTVFLVHHNDMSSGHAPMGREMEDEVFELPERVVAIEHRLKGVPHEKAADQKSLPAAKPMQVIGDIGFGSRAPAVSLGGAQRKRKRARQDDGTSTDGVSVPASRGSIWSLCTPVLAPIVSQSDLELVHSRKHLQKLHYFCSHAEALNAALFPFYKRSHLSVLVENARESFSRRTQRDFFFSPGTLRAIRRLEVQ